MYLPAHFEENRTEVQHALIRARPLGLLVTPALQAHELPFVIDPDPAPHGTLRAHVARANPLWHEADGQEVLVVFQGPQAYVSPGWYPSKAESGKVVPTWNYVMLQARGKLRAIDDAQWLRAFVTRLTDTHEARQAQPWRVSDAPPAYLDTMLRAIVGIEIELVGLAGKWKVSQNRPAADREGVARGLNALGDEQALAMAQLVEGHGRR